MPKFKIRHDESNDEWVEEFDTEDDAYQQYGPHDCYIEKIEE